MSLHSVSLQCPGCGSPISTDMEHCPYCYGPITITSFNSVYGMTAQQTNKYLMGYRKALSDNPDNLQLKASVAMCYLKLKMYDKAYEQFEYMMENNFDDSESFFYAAVCLLKGKRPFLVPLVHIKKVLELLDAAFMIENRGVYYLMSAYIKLDFYAKKALKVSPNWQEDFRMAKENHLSKEDAKILFELLAVSSPVEFGEII